MYTVDAGLLLKQQRRLPQPRPKVAPPIDALASTSAKQANRPKVAPYKPPSAAAAAATEKQAIITSTGLFFTAKPANSVSRRPQPQQQPTASSRRSQPAATPKPHASQLAYDAKQRREAAAEEEIVRAAVERRDTYARAQQAQAALVEQKMRQLMSNPDEDPNAMNKYIASSIAAKQSGGAVHSIMSSGYGYE